MIMRQIPLLKCDHKFWNLILFFTEFKVFHTYTFYQSNFILTSLENDYHSYSKTKSKICIKMYVVYNHCARQINKYLLCIFSHDTGVKQPTSSLSFTLNDKQKYSVWLRQNHIQVQQLMQLIYSYTLKQWCY